MQVLKILAKRITWLTLFVNTQKHEILGVYVLTNLKEMGGNVIIIGISREGRVYSGVLPGHASHYLHNPLICEQMRFSCLLPKKSIDMGSVSCYSNLQELAQRDNVCRPQLPTSR